MKIESSNRLVSELSAQWLPYLKASNCRDPEAYFLSYRFLSKTFTSHLGTRTKTLELLDSVLNHLISNLQHHGGQDDGSTFFGQKPLWWTVHQSTVKSSRPSFLKFVFLKLTETNCCADVHCNFLQRKIFATLLLVTISYGVELEFIELEAELQDGYNYGDGWSWQGKFLLPENLPEEINLGSGRSSGSSDSSDSDKDDNDDGVCFSKSFLLKILTHLI